MTWIVEKYGQIPANTFSLRYTWAGKYQASKTVGKESDFVILLNINTIYHLDMTDDNNTAVTANW